MLSTGRPERGPRAVYTQVRANDSARGVQRAVENGDSTPDMIVESAGLRI